MTNELTTTQNPNLALYKQSTDAADICKKIVCATAKKIQGKEYVCIEGWQAIALAHGCVASAHSVEKVEGGIRAIGRIIQMNSGIEIATAEGFVGDDEKVWLNRPEYARRAMAQTRAMSRACRSAFAHVVVMMNAGLSTTPAEEVPEEGFNNTKKIKPKVVPQNVTPKKEVHSEPPYIEEEEIDLNQEILNRLTLRLKKIVTLTELDTFIADTKEWLEKQSPELKEQIKFEIKKTRINIEFENTRANDDANANNADIDMGF